MQGGFAAGLADLQRAQELYEQLDLPQQVRNTVNGIASLYSRVGDYQQARDYYETSLKLQEQAGLTRDLVVTRYNLGRVLEKLNDWNGAEQTFNEVLRLSRQISYARGEAYALRGLAVVQNSRGNHIDALRCWTGQPCSRAPRPIRCCTHKSCYSAASHCGGLHRPRESIETLRTSLDIFVKAESVHDVGSVRAELGAHLRPSATGSARTNSTFSSRRPRTRCCSGSSTSAMRA